METSITCVTNLEHPSSCISVALSGLLLAALQNTVTKIRLLGLYWQCLYLCSYKMDYSPAA